MKIFPIIVLISAGLFLAGCSGGGTMEQHTSKPADTKKRDQKKALSYFLKGVALEQRGDLAAAILEYQEALEADEQAGIYYSIAKNYYLLSKLSFAKQNAMKALEIDSAVADYYFLLSDIYSSSRKHDSSAIVLENLLRRDSLQLNAYYKLARQYEQSRPKKAAEIYEALLRKTGKEWTVLLRLAELYEKTGDAEKTISSMEALLSIDRDNTQIVKLLADYYIRFNRSDDALRLAEEYLLSYPDDIGFQEIRGRVYIAQKDYRSAIAAYAEIIGNNTLPFGTRITIANDFYVAALRDSSLLEPVKKLFYQLDRDTTAWEVKMYLGAIAIEQRDDSSAIKYFGQVTKLDPSNKEAWIRLGGLLFDNRKYKEAAELLQSGIASFPEDFTINLILGLSYAQSDKDSTGLPYLEKAVKLNPMDVTALSAYGYSLSKLKRNEEAAEFIKAALNNDPDNLNLLGTLGLIYDALGNFTASDSAYGAVLKKDPDNALVNNNFAYALSKRNERLSEALEMVTKALETEPANSAYLDTKGWILYKMGDYKAAKGYIEKAIEIGGARPVIIDHLGDVLYRLGEKDAAVSEWKKAFEIDPTLQGLREKIERESLD
ncbi:MAG: tetratricopeptide repeat protein [Ignavibacteriales bacterium]|nr:MAG: tetratricopeptide repeat protein [Ignavibacteriales bacterium]